MNIITRVRNVLCTQQRLSSIPSSKLQSTAQLGQTTSKTVTWKPERQHFEMDNIARSSTKHTITIQGLTITFTTTNSMDTKKLTEFLHSQLTQLASKDNTILLQFQQITRPTQELSNDANNIFIEFNYLITSLIHIYDKTQQEQHENFERSLNHNYVFKVSKKTTVFDKHWIGHLKELQHFKNQYGHCNVSRTTKGHDQLGNWLADQRRKLRRGKLTQQQYEMLTELGVDWDRAAYYGQANSMIFVDSQNT